MTVQGTGSALTLAAATSATVFRGRSGRRISYSIANVGANAAYVNMSNEQTATAGEGIYLPVGAILTGSYNGRVPPWQGHISAVSTAGTSLALYEEVLL